MGTTTIQHDRPDPDSGWGPDTEETDAGLLLSAALALHAATERLARLDAESRAIARLAAEALMRGDVSRTALALVANVEGRAGVLDLLRGSARLQQS